MKSQSHRCASTPTRARIPASPASSLISPLLASRQQKTCLDAHSTPARWLASSGPNQPASLNLSSQHAARNPPARRPAPADDKAFALCQVFDWLSQWPLGAPSKQVDAWPDRPWSFPARKRRIFLAFVFSGPYGLHLLA